MKKGGPAPYQLTSAHTVWPLARTSCPSLPANAATMASPRPYSSSSEQPSRGALHSPVPGVGDLDPRPSGFGAHH
jgi:hypothetical protein